MTNFRRVSTSSFGTIGGSMQAGAGFDRLDLTPVVVRWGQILLAGHERRILAGLDVDERPMRPTVRERTPGLSRRLGSGPPLAPKYRASRVLSHARVVTGRQTGGWGAVITWPNFVARSNGQQILLMHAYPGAGARYPRRDVVSHVSPVDRAQCLEALRDWTQGRGQSGGGSIRERFRRAVGSVFGGLI